MWNRRTFEYVRVGIGAHYNMFMWNRRTLEYVRVGIGAH